MNRKLIYTKDISIVVDDNGDFYLEGVWPEYTMISKKFIDGADQGILWRSRRLVYFKLANSEAVYELMDRSVEDEDLYLIRLQRLEI